MEYPMLSDSPGTPPHKSRSQWWLDREEEARLEDEVAEWEMVSQVNQVIDLGRPPRPQPEEKSPKKQKIGHDTRKENGKIWQAIEVFPGYCKLNVHDCYTEKPFWNGNKTWVGAVIRDDKGKIVRMLKGTQAGFSEKRIRCFSMMMELRLAWEEKKELIILETDSWFAFEAYYGKWCEECKYEIEQIQRRKRDKNVKIEVIYLPPTAN
ncbi:hypothetical protein POM88_021357 [Heracleum sosnowskyi]|uniref:RNase H type-1 domain-containing protein n=1 Tax=Heracleum sosnowskyi TaxID=360622 RepID=A0AAD8IFN2_9APIA|nr:hypothetical protein POM88_021357 [Heracleum sosnowskyi]